MKNTNWLRWPLEHYPITLLIIGILFVMGLYGMYIMPKDEWLDLWSVTFLPLER